jgi:hypothetical protein
VRATYSRRRGITRVPTIAVKATSAPTFSAVMAKGVQKR